MNKIIAGSASAGAVLCFLAYWIGTVIKRKFKWGILNPLLIAIILVSGFLLAFRVDYDSFNSGAKYISWFLTPATVSLAVPLYQQLERLKKNIKAILISIFVGSVTSMGSVLALAFLFRLTHEQYVTFLPKSITTAIGMTLAEEMGGIAAITATTIIVTGIFGSMVCDGIFKLLKITDDVAKGLALGTSAHAIGTSKAMEISEVAGAMSSLSIVTAGIITVIGANLFAMIY